MKWQKVEIKNIAQVKNGFAFKSNEYTEKGIRVIRITNVQKGVIVDSNPQFVDESRRNEFKEYLLFNGDILVSLTGNVGRVGVLTKNLEPAVLNQRVACIRINNEKEIIPKYLFQFLNSNIFEKECIKNSNGAAQLNVSSKWVENYQIPLPPLKDQIHIANLLTRAENLIAKRKESIKALDDLLKSTFLEMFGDPVKNEKGWEKKRIDEIAEVRIGPFGSLLHSSDYVENGIPLINPSHIIDGEIVPDSFLTITHEKYKELESYQLKINDVVVARRGEIGRCAIVRTLTPLFCGTGSMYIRFNSDYYPILLQYQIYNTSLRDFLESKAKGVTMKNLNSTTLGDLEILYPPRKLQDKFVGAVKKIETLKLKYGNSLNELESLYGEVNKRAFNGKLFLSNVLIS